MLPARAGSAGPYWWAPPLLLLAGCASREVPTRYPETSAASPKAAAGAPLHVTEALAGEPPLPGEEAPGWQGLRDPTEAENTPEVADPHAHHRGHHAH